MVLTSTRNPELRENFGEAVLRGIAPDGGLFYPATIPDLRKTIADFTSDISFQELSARTLLALFPETFSAEQARQICYKAFPFSPRLCPIGNSIMLLELFHGPSCAFKDFGASFLATVMETLLRDKEKKATILTATSGDTGSAVIQAFLGKEGITVFVLYPSGRISPMQEKQLSTHGKNIVAVEVKGSFDDCQRMVKEAFADNELCSRYSLTSANSINIGRLIPQSFYYLYADTQLTAEEKRRRLFTVPSGNFGNLTAGVLAWCWGMPAKYFLAACNANDAVPQYLETGVFTPRTSVHTLANAMDVGNPSNFERLRSISKQKHCRLQDILRGEVVLDSAIQNTIQRYYAEKKIFLCPHTAAGVCASERILQLAATAEGEDLRIAGETPCIISLATADPGKFAEIIKDSTQASPPIPEKIADFMNRQKISIPAEPHLDALKHVLKQHCFP